VHAYGVNVILWDEWAVVPVIHNWYQHTLTFSLLWAQHNESRMVIPKLLDLLSARLTNFNTKDSMYAGAVMLAASYAAFVVLCDRSSRINLWLLVPTAYVYFGLLQWENALWGFQMAWFLVLLCVMCCLLALERLEMDRPVSRSLLFSLALSLATIASFSLFQGLLVWPGSLLYIIGRGTRRIFIITWALAGSIVCILYFLGFSFHATGAPSLFEAVENPLRSLEYFFVASEGSFCCMAR
jgi:hypothetical protein